MNNIFYGILILLCCTSCRSAQKTETVDPDATTETKNLYANLKRIQGEKILFGQQDATVYGIGWKYDKDQSDIKKVSGEYPAVYGWDLGHIELGDSVNLDNIHFEVMREHMVAAYRRGGINTVSWHLRNPYTDGSSWDVTSDQVVVSILPGGSKHDVYMQWLDRLAAFFLSVVEEGGTPIPIIFRPFHEHTGNWFWWGAPYCSPEDYTALWLFTVEYLRDKKHVHQLLYVYSPDRVTSKEEYFERYPGDAYVDILGLDMYHRGADAQAPTYISEVNQVMEILETYSHEHHKAFVFSETGAEGLPMPNWFTQVLYPAISKHKPAYVLVWRNAYDIEGHFYGPYPEHPAAADFLLFKDKLEIYLEKGTVDFYKKERN